MDCGEDAFKVRQSDDGTSWIIAVADGVGGWASKGIDSSTYSWALVDCLTSEFYSKDEYRHLTPKKLLVNCVNSIQNSYKTQLYSDPVNAFKIDGSSTAVVLKINCERPNSCDLFAANLGDSGFVVYKLADTDSKWVEVMRSVEQQHSFNFPFQAAANPSLGDSPANAEEYGMTFEERSSYLALVASDGLFDNLFRDEILDILNGHTSNITSMVLHSLSKELAEKSILVGNSRTVCGPFCKNAQAHGYKFSGGYLGEYVGGYMDNISLTKSRKLDDTSIVLAYISIDSPK
ncbi:hypothetical protein MDAP_001776 [Mitosporidium daphniae]